MGSTRRDLEATSDDDTRDLEGVLHELRVHQVELEMQNRELREAQGLLEESRARYADLYDYAPVGYLTLDPDGIIHEINLRGAALLGIPREQLLNRPLAAIGPLKDKRAVRVHLERCARAKVQTMSEIALEFATRGTRTMQMISDPRPDAVGTTIGYRTILVDISGQKQLETSLRLLSDAGQTLVGSIDFTTTLEATARLAVPALADLCMVDVRDRSGEIERLVVVFADPEKQRTLTETFERARPAPGWTTPQARAIASGESMLLAEVSDELRLNMAYDDAHLDAIRAAGIRSLMVVPLAARDRIVGALTFAAAESERRYGSSDLALAKGLADRAALAIENARLHAEARNAIAARDAVLNVVSHDLRNPLSLILGRTSLMLEFPIAADRRAESRRSNEAMYHAAERMNRLIEDLLDVSAIEQGRFSIERNWWDVGSLVEEAVESAQNQAAHKSLQLEYDFPDGNDFAVYCDAHRVQQVFANLIGNAVKFTAPGGTIHLRVEHRDNEACFSVRDTGPGIAPSDLPHVFSRFWQAEHTGRIGTGLGLSIAKGIVEAHGGRLWAESQQGEGSTFSFTLPLSAREREQTTRPRSPGLEP